MIEVTGRFGQPPPPVAPGVGFHGVGFLGGGLLGVGFAYLPCTMTAEGGIDPAYGDGARVGCRPARAILRDLLLSVASLRDGGGGSWVIRGFLRSGGMGCDILSKRDLLPAVGVMGVAAHRTGAVARAGGVGTMCEIDDRNMSSVYGGEYL